MFSELFALSLYSFIVRGENKTESRERGVWRDMPQLGCRGWSLSSADFGGTCCFGAWSCQSWCWSHRWPGGSGELRQEGDVVCGRALLAAQPQGERGFLHAGLAWSLGTRWVFRMDAGKVPARCSALLPRACHEVPLSETGSGKG